MPRTDSQLLPHLFRTEFGKITSVLAKHFHLRHIEVAEDIASETFLEAAETWPYHGVPENPTAWLYAVAKNKARNALKRISLFEDKIKSELNPPTDITAWDEIDLSTDGIQDSQLRMLFALSHPALPPESQVALCLRILCGFGIDDIASAFLTNKETINKRLVRAREKLRTEKLTLDLPDESALVSRLDNVLTTLYLLFSEGYYSETRSALVDEDLCEEAIRLAKILVEVKSTNLPQVHALLALMYFQSSRLKARIGSDGDVVLYHHQDESLWNREYISLGGYHLNLASTGNRLTKYHLEASIAFWHTVREDTKEKWESILQLYNRLLQLEYSPIAALNRTYALSKANGLEEAIAEAQKLQLTTNRYYHSLLGELHGTIDTRKALAYFSEALRLSKSPAEKTSIEKKIDALQRRPAAIKR